VGFEVGFLKEKEAKRKCALPAPGHTVFIDRVFLFFSKNEMPELLL